MMSTAGMSADEIERWQDEYLAREIEKRRKKQANGAADPGGAAKDGWPVIHRAAFHGFVGNLVKTIEPRSEADPASLLVQVLIAAGNMIGRRCHFQIEATRHYTNLFGVVVGDTAKARKGTSWNHVKAISKIADEQWHDDRNVGGLSSGEGLINEVRDEVVEFDPKAGDYRIKDPGELDKRLMVIEPEFSSALAMMERPGNKLSQLIRQAWDGDTLRSMALAHRLKATGAHISIVGHITKEELKSCLTRTEMANGFANRFLFILARRSKKLAFGGGLSEAQVKDLGEILQAAIASLPEGGEHRIGMTPEAEIEWVDMYERLSESAPGLIGAITARSEAQTLRLAMVYALLAGTLEIDVDHLRAGLAVWQYCEASAAHVFDCSLGNPVADEILLALRTAGSDGVSRTSIRDMFSRHRTDAIAASLATLLSAGLARCEMRATAGRPVEMWFAV